MPLLRASNFRGGALEQTHTSFAVLVLVLPVDSGRTWTEDELEIVEVVADQVTVALSHAAVLEESLAVKRQLLEQNAMLKVEQKNALVAKEARNLFQKVIIREIAKPVRTIKACLAMLQDEQLKADQHAMVKGGLTLSSLIEDFIEPLPFQNGLELKLRPFDLHSIIEEVWRASSLFCALKGLPFQPRFSNETPKRVVGDEFRILQALLYMVGYFVGSAVGDAAIVFDISVDQELRQAWKQNVPDDDSVSLNFKVGRADSIDREDINQKYEVTGEEVCLSLCKKLAELMHGNLSVSSVSQGLQININFQIRMKREQTKERGMPPKCLDQETALNLLGSMKVLLVDADGICRNLSRRVLERTGCQVTLASSWFQCLNFLNFKKGDFHLLLLDTKILKDGQDITGRIKKMKLDGWIRIIVLVSSNDSITLEECVQYGIHGVLCKPIVLQEMLEELHRISLQSQGMH